MEVRKYAKFAAIPAGLLVAGLVVGQASSAAFTAQTSTGANTFASASVALTSDQVGAKVFNVTNMVPGSNGTQRVNVSYTGTVQTSVKMYAKDGDTTGPLAQALKLKITQGSDVVFDGTLAAFSAKTTWATGLDPWVAAGPTSSKTYDIAWSLPSDAPSTVSGKTTQLTFVWEAQTA